MSTVSDEAVAWFFMGEGSATFVCSRRLESKGLMSALGYRISPRVSFTNTDNAILVPVKQWLKFKRVHFVVTIQKHKNPKYLPLTIIRVDTFKDAKKFLRIILPYVLGRKKLVCELMLECLRKYGGRGNWSDIMREKAIYDKKTGKVSGVKWNFDEERHRFLETMKYRDKIVAINGGHRAKYNYEFFAKLWGMN